MTESESYAILDRAEVLFRGLLSFKPKVKSHICKISDGYPYFTQLLGKECVTKANQLATNEVTEEVLESVLDDIRNGKSFPTLERAYQRAIGNSPDRQILLHLLAEQPEEQATFDEDIGRVFLKRVRKEAEDMDIQYVDQLLPRLLDEAFGPAISRVPERPGIYEFVNPVFRLYVRLRHF